MAWNFQCPCVFSLRLLTRSTTSETQFSLHSYRRVYVVLRIKYGVSTHYWLTNAFTPMFLGYVFHFCYIRNSALILADPMLTWVMYLITLEWWLMQIIFLLFIWVHHFQSYYQHFCITQNHYSNPSFLFFLFLTSVSNLFSLIVEPWSLWP